ncbi:hypothetical protein [Trichormus sp. NMC-1]|uniref:hypothetical protein n=1 Tax=Trichormus sp. NMC-1 TaxID=1853259 RepID=UPI0008DBFEBF|nr:hypothetical protein [Trichormus sp. NMC-1]
MNFKYKYNACVLLPLTIKDTKINPVSYRLMVFPSKPEISQGEIKTLYFIGETGTSINFDALLTNIAKPFLDGDTYICNYVFEIQDRDVALRIAQLYKNNNPGKFEDENPTE